MKTEIEKIKYLKIEKGFLDEMKSIFHNYLRVIIWWKQEKQQTIALTLKTLKLS